jgi:hypothetical protein
MGGDYLGIAPILLGQGRNQVAQSLGATQKPKRSITGRGHDAVFFVKTPHWRQALVSHHKRALTACTSDLLRKPITSHALR